MSYITDREGKQISVGDFVLVHGDSDFAEGVAYQIVRFDFDGDPILTKDDGYQTFTKCSRVEKIFQQPQQNSSETTKGESTMSSISNIAKTNISAAKQAAKIEVGSVATKQMVKVIKPHLPMMIRGYADSPLVGVLVANIFSYAVANFAQGNDKAELIADAMLEGAMVDAFKSFDLNALINDLVDGVDTSKLTSISE